MRSQRDELIYNYQHYIRWVTKTALALKADNVGNLLKGHEIHNLKYALSDMTPKAAEAEQQLLQIGVTNEELRELYYKAEQSGLREGAEIIEEAIANFKPNSRLGGTGTKERWRADWKKDKDQCIKQIRLEAAARNPRIAHADVIGWWKDQEEAVDLAATRQEAAHAKAKRPMDYATREPSAAVGRA